MNSEQCGFFIEAGSNLIDSYSILILLPSLGGAAMSSQRPKPPLPFYPSSPTAESGGLDDSRAFSTPSPRLANNNISSSSSNNSPDVISPTNPPYLVIGGTGNGGSGVVVGGVRTPELEFPEMILLSGGAGGGGTTTRTSQLIEAVSRSLSRSSSSIGSAAEMAASSSATAKNAPTNSNNTNNDGGGGGKKAFEHTLTSQVSFSEAVERYSAAMAAGVKVLRAAVTLKQQKEALDEMQSTVKSAKREGFAGR